MLTIGPLARFVDDLTLCYNLIRGPDPTSPYTVPSAEARPERVDLAKLRCAVFTDIGSVPVESTIRQAIERTARELENLGLTVDEAVPPIGQAQRLWWDYAMADGNQPLYEMLGDNLKLSRQRLRSLFKPSTSKTAAEFFALSLERDRFRVELANFMERYPIIVSPPFCITAFTHGAMEVDIEGKTFGLYEARWPTFWVNCAGLPAVVIPAGQNGVGLPTGVQIVGRAFAEEEVLAVARALEKPLGGFRKPPL